METILHCSVSYVLLRTVETITIFKRPLLANQNCVCLIENDEKARHSEDRIPTTRSVLFNNMHVGCSKSMICDIRKRLRLWMDIIFSVL